MFPLPEGGVAWGNYSIVSGNLLGVESLGVSVSIKLQLKPKWHSDVNQKYLDCLHPWVKLQYYSSQRGNEKMLKGGLSVILWSKLSLLFSFWFFTVFYVLDFIWFFKKFQYLYKMFTISCAKITFFSLYVVVFVYMNQVNLLTWYSILNKNNRIWLGEFSQSTNNHPFWCLAMLRCCLHPNTM